MLQFKQFLISSTPVLTSLMCHCFELLAGRMARPRLLYATFTYAGLTLLHVIVEVQCHVLTPFGVGS
jgi:hypothetical protein